MTPRSRLRAGFAAALAVSSWVCAQVEEHSPNAIISRPIDSLEVWDRQVDLLTRLAWAIDALSTSAGPDRTGHTLDDYWNDNILTAEVKHRLDALRENAETLSAGGDGDALKRTIAEAAPIIQAELYKSYIVRNFWSLQDAVAFQLKLLQPWLDRAPEAERKTVADRTRSAFDALTKDYVTALQSKDHVLPPHLGMAVTARNAAEFLTEERFTLVKQQADLPLPFQVVPVKRTAPCTGSNAPKPGATKVGIAAGFPSSDPFYPAEMKRHAVVGNVDVTVHVSATGCAEEARLAVSSGVKALDDAGLQYALAGNYIPAADGDRAVPGDLTFRIKFKL